MKNKILFLFYRNISKWNNNQEWKILIENKLKRTKKNNPKNFYEKNN